MGLGGENRTAATFLAVILACLCMGGCGGVAASGGAAGTGCRAEIRGVGTVLKSETSGLTCAAINRLTVGLPSRPQAFVIIGESPHVLWKCHLFSLDAPRLLLRCAHHQKEFSILRSER